MRTFSIPLLLGIAACAGNYRLDEAAVPGNARAPESILSLKWKKQLKPHDFMDYRTQEWSSAVIDERGVVYVGSSAKKFLAIRMSDGRVLWTIRTDGAISSAPLLNSADGTIYFGADDGRMYAVDARQGRVRWQYATQGTINRAPALSDGLLLFTSSEGRIYCVDAKTGKWRWQYDRESPEGFTIQGYAGVAVQRSTAFTGFPDGTLVALSAYSGDVIWTRSLSGDSSRFTDVDTTPVVDGDLLLVSSYTNGVYALSPASGSVRWRFPVEGASGIIVHQGRIFLTAPRSGLIALDREGRLLWRQAIAQGVPSIPVARGPFLFITGTETGLHVVSASSGRLFQYFDPGHGFSAPPVVGDGVVVVLSNMGWLYAFGMQPTGVGRAGG